MNDTNLGRKTIRDKQEVDILRVMIGLLISFLMGLLIGGSIMYLLMPPKVEKAQMTIQSTDDLIRREVLTDRPAENVIGFKPLNIPLDDHLQEYIYNLSLGYGIDFSLVMAIIEQESSFRTGAVSETNDYGLMQINAANHEWLSKRLGVTDFLDPEQNIQAGLFILRNLYENYDSDEEVLMAYNMGEAGAARMWNDGIYETQYTDGVLIKQEKFEKELENEN